MRFYWQQSCPGKAAAEGCPSTPGCPSAPDSGTRPRPPPAPARVAGAAPTGRCWWYPPNRAGKPEARVRAQRRRPKQSKKTLELEVWNSPRTWIEARSARREPKQAWAAWKPEAQIEARSALRSRKRSSKKGPQAKISTLLSIVNVKTKTQFRKYFQENLSIILPYLQTWMFSTNFWIELVSTNRTLWENLLFSIVRTRTQQPETAKDIVPDLQSWKINSN